MLLFRLAERIAPPMKPKPSISIAQVDGSGTALTDKAPKVRALGSLANSLRSGVPKIGVSSEIVASSPDSKSTDNRNASATKPLLNETVFVPK